jgi:CPA2 family monovalent cation:H+ antiporter-2
MEQIALALFVCLILGLVSKSLALPPIPFYIVAGVLLGNGGLKVITPDEISAFLSHLGLIFLLFYIGLELKPERFKARGQSFLIAGLIDLNVNLLIGFTAALALGFGYYDAFVIGSAFYISSSAIVIASLVENKKLILAESETIVWLMIFEDIVLIFLIFALSMQQNPLFPVLKIIAIVIFFFMSVRILKPFLLKILRREDDIPVVFTFSVVFLAASISRRLEIPEVLTVIALALALSTTDPKAFERISKPFKDIFLLIFFFFFGISVEFSDGFPMHAITISAVGVGSKLLSGFLIGRIVHKRNSAGIEIGTNTIARGEFSIALAAISGSEIVSGPITLMVLITSVVGSVAARYSSKLKVMV